MFRNSPHCAAVRARQEAHIPRKQEPLLDCSHRRERPLQAGGSVPSWKLPLLWWAGPGVGAVTCLGQRRPLERPPDPAALTPSTWHPYSRWHLWPQQVRDFMLTCPVGCLWPQEAKGVIGCRCKDIYFVVTAGLGVGGQLPRPTLCPVSRNLCPPLQPWLCVHPEGSVHALVRAPGAPNCYVAEGETEAACGTRCFPAGQSEVELWGGGHQEDPRAGSRSHE